MIPLSIIWLLKQEYTVPPPDNFPGMSSIMSKITHRLVTEIYSIECWNARLLENILFSGDFKTQKELPYRWRGNQVHVETVLKFEKGRLICPNITRWVDLGTEPLTWVCFPARLPATNIFIKPESTIDLTYIKLLPQSAIQRHTMSNWVISEQAKSHGSQVHFYCESTFHLSHICTVYASQAYSRKYPYSNSRFRQVNWDFLLFNYAESCFEQVTLIVQNYLLSFSFVEVTRMLYFTGTRLVMFVIP